MSEGKVVAECLKKNKKFYQPFYALFLPYILTIVRRYGIQPSEEADVVQEIFIEVFSSMDNFDEGKGSFKTWMRTVAVHKILNIKRKQKSWKILDIDEQSEQLGSVEIDLKTINTAYIMEAIQALPLGYQTVFNLYAIDGYSHKEIGVMLNISEASSRSQLSRAKKALQITITQILNVG